VNAQQATTALLSEVRDIVRAGGTELTGKAKRRAWEEGGEVVGRFRGLKSSFPELERVTESPGAIAGAVDRGKGKVYDRIYRTVYEEMLRRGFAEPRKVYSGRGTIEPHGGNARCKWCGQFHAKGAHRFHGPGSFHQTHLFSFGSMKNPRSVTFAHLPAGAVFEFTAERMPAGPWRKVSRDQFRLAGATAAEKSFGVRPSVKVRVVQPGLFAGPLLEGNPRRRRRRSAPRPNAGRGLRFTFHGRFKHKADAVRRERDTPGAFIREKNGYYLVMTERRPAGGNPRRPRRKTYRAKNPPIGRREIYSRVGSITAQKGPGHACDAKCKRAQHWYEHKFKKGVGVYKEPNGDVRLHYHG